MKKTFTILFASSLALACGSDDGGFVWEPDTVVFHQPDGSRTEAHIEGECAEFDGDLCFDPSEECGSRGAAEVYVDDEGQVLEVICFPSVDEGNANVVVASGGTAEAEPGNNDILVLEGDADAPAYSGDLDLEPNNVTIWGDDPATSVLDGDLTINGNNTLVSGVTITGDVVIAFNEARFSNCVIEGDLTITGNGAKVAGCLVRGDVVVVGNNSELTLLEVEGSFEDGGMNTECVDSQRLINGDTVRISCGDG